MVLFKNTAVCASAILAATASATPVVHYPRTANSSAFTNLNGLKFTHFNQSLPNVTILATGTFPTPPTNLIGLQKTNEE